MTLTLALPTGRLFEETKSLLSRCGMSVSDEALTHRQLRIAAGEITLVLAKDRDVPTYVEHGVADAGVVGKDVLAEQAPEVYEPLDLGVGRCRMVVARPRQSGGKSYRDRSVVRVATKYPRVTTTYFHRDGIPVEVIPLSGSVELAPLLGLSDVIVDVVQTGRTLEANGLEIGEVLFESTARLIVNRASFRLENDAVRGLIRRLEEGVRA
ncbi:MAG TPA: ATP phosphoribosyltransferase [Vicinamibacteria bacterium]|nr:ATP phosphoribosyltransferase [Vicinamibacteria bacterium]